MAALAKLNLDAKLMIGREIGRGTYCTAWEGELNGKQVVVKRIHSVLLEYEAPSRELVQSAHLLKQLSHPHIVKIIAYLHSDDGDHAIVMERLDCNLGKYLKDHEGRLSRQRQIDFCLQIADAIHYLHSQQPPVVYRDLSAKNVLVLMLDDILKLGSCQQAARLPSCGYFDEPQPGRIPYMPPEALVDNDIRYNEKIDVFSLGVLMLEIATQYLSLPGISGIGTTPDIQHRAEDLSRLPEDHPLKPIILQCLRDDPGERPDSGAVFRMLSEAADMLGFEEHYSKVVSNQINVTLKITKCTTIGPPRVGKTCFKHLLTGQEWDVEAGTASTDVMKAPEWVECYSVEEGGVEDVWRLMSKKQQTGELLRAISTITTPSDDDLPTIQASGTPSTATLGHHSPTTTSCAAATTPTWSVVSPTTMPTDASRPHLLSASQKPRTLMQGLMALADAFSGKDLQDILKDKVGKVLGESRLIHFIDTGGQAIYHDVHPVLVTSASVYLVVFSLKEFYQKQCMEQLKYFQSDLIQRPLRSIYTFGTTTPQEKNHTSEAPKIIIVGTHVDQIPLDNRKEFLLKLHDMISVEIGDKPYRQFVQHDSEGHSFWAVDNTQAGREADRDVEKYIYSLRKKAQEKEMSVRVPLPWMLLKLVMDAKEVRYCKYSKLLEEAHSRGYVGKDSPNADLDSMLRLFHTLGLIYHMVPSGYKKEDSLVFVDPNCLYSATSDFLMAAKEEIEYGQLGNEEYIHGIQATKEAVHGDEEVTGKEIRQQELAPTVGIVGKQAIIQRMEANVDSIKQEVEKVLQRVEHIMKRSCYHMLEYLVDDLKEVGQKYKMSPRDSQEAESLKDKRQMLIGGLVHGLVTSMEVLLSNSGGKGDVDHVKKEVDKAVKYIRAQYQSRSIDDQDLDQFLSILSDLRIVAKLDHSGRYVVPAALPKLRWTDDIAGSADPIFVTVVSQTIMNVCYVPSGLFCCLISELVTALDWTVIPLARTHVAFTHEDLTGKVHLIEHDSYIKIKVESDATLKELTTTCQSVMKRIHKCIGQVYFHLYSAPTAGTTFEETLVWGFQCLAHPDSTHIAALSEDDSDCCAECLLMGSTELQPVTLAQKVWTKTVDVS